MAAALWDTYKQWADVQEDVLLTWLDPGQGYKLSPMRDYPLMNLASSSAICVAYLVFVVVGTLVMKAGVPAFKTSPIQFIYNPLQVVACSYMCVEACIQAYRHGYSVLPCNAFNAANPVMGNVLYMFYLSKLLDFMDTFFIIAGKKWNQLSLLHVYHHLSVFFVYYANASVAYDGDIFMTVILNGFIHTIMYMYYFVSAHTKEIWWKKHLTTMQMIQFVLMNVQSYFMVTRKCPGMPEKIPVFYMAYVQTLFWLFMNFFIRAYCMKPRKSAAVKKDAATKKQQ